MGHARPALCAAVRGAGHRLIVAALAAALVACGHSDAFTPVDPGSTGPFAAGEPARLTYSDADDLTPAWLADGSGVAYSFAKGGAGESDRCIGVLPPDGGQRIAERCSRAFGEADSVDIFGEPAPLPDGRMAWVHGAKRRDALGGSVYQRLELGGADARTPTSVLVTLPFALSDGNARAWISQLRWLDATHGIFVAGDSGNLGVGATYTSGRELVRISVTGGGATLDPVPNTAEASSVAVGESPDVVYFTRNGDSRVYRLQLSSAAITIAHDFGAEGIARDVQVGNGTLWAVVGGLVQLVGLPQGGVAQVDRGGQIVAVDLAGGTERLHDVNPLILFRRLAVAPAGAALVASGVAVSISSPDPQGQPTLTDTTVVSGADLWRFARP
jgi:hypothetical protein